MDYSTAALTDDLGLIYCTTAEKAVAFLDNHDTKDKKPNQPDKIHQFPVSK